MSHPNMSLCGMLNYTEIKTTEILLKMLQAQEKLLPLPLHYLEEFELGALLITQD